MTFDLYVISVSDKGVQVALDDGSPAFWLPRQKVEWHGTLEPGEIVHATVPRWLALKHQQLVASRVSTQKVLDLHKAEMDPEKAQGKLPMADSNDLRGAIFKNDRKESDRHPDYKGDITIGGQKYWLAGWIKEGKRGKYLSLAAKPAEEQRQEQQRAQPEQPNAYAAASAKRSTAGGPTFPDDDAIPFAPDR